MVLPLLIQKIRTGIEKDGRIFSQAANECMILTFKGKVEGVRKAILNWKSEILQTKYSTLMRGRQTFHPPEDKNIPAPIAVKILMDIIERNVGRTPRHVLSLLIIHHSIDGIKRY